MTSKPSATWFLFSFLFIAASSFSQTGKNFTGSSIDNAQYPTLSDQFRTYHLVEFPVSGLDEFVQSSEYAYSLNFQFPGLPEWDISLFPFDIRAKGYRVVSNDGIHTSDKVITFRGHLGKGGDSDVRMVIHPEYFGGFVSDGIHTWYFEPAYRLMDAQVPRNLIVVYESRDVIPNPDATCTAIETEEFKNQQMEKMEEGLPGEIQGEGQAMMNCYETEVATAHDKYMFDKYGTVAACESHAMNVMNNVQTNWDNEFADEIQMFITEQFVEQNNINWPTSSRNAGTVLSTFRTWANGGGFSRPYDVGQLWTARDFDGGTVGIAYLSAICGGNRYHALQDFTNNQQSLRVLVSHELGHNFSCQHDAAGSPFIMAPAVNNSNQWSNASISAVNNFVPRLGCLASCNTAQPPVANFSGSPTSGCASLTVRFTDQSSGPPNSWDWSFPGGTPSSSTDQNPTVVYDTYGTYDVTLTVSNGAGSNTRTITNYISVNDVPEADFTYNDNQLVVDFTNLSTRADILTWDFGDGTSPITGAPNQSIPGGTHQGRTTGTYNAPRHIYDMDGTYVVTLTASNNCGADVITQAVVVVSPVSAEFTADVRDGCATLEVNFESQASPNTTEWFWEFPGGTPATSRLENPTVFYAERGTYDVILEVRNSRYVDRIRKGGFIVVRDVPEADFNYQVNNLTVRFTNATQYASSIRWDFGDGNISNQTNPVHTYQFDSTYTVLLIATNSCGNDTATATITVGSLPSAAFSSDVAEGCTPLQVQYQNLSSPNATRWFWEFPGGSPSTSTEREPLVSYDQAGTFNVTLIAYNGLGSDTARSVGYITTDPSPEAAFSSNVDSNRVDFTNLSEFGLSYLWDFGDGEISTEEDPSHVYEEDGIYNVILIVQNDCGEDTATQQITIGTLPNAGFSQDTTRGCAPLTVAFENRSSDNAVSFEWHFPGGSPDTSYDRDPVVQYLNPGTFDVTLIAFNNQGSDTLNLEDHIQVNDLPQASFDLVIDRNSVEFSNLSQRGDQYFWDFGDGNNSTEEEPVHSYNANGTYLVQLITVNDCGRDTTSESLQINAFPVARLSSDTASGCSPLVVIFENQSTQAESVEWEFEGGDPVKSTEDDPVVSYIAPGSYTVRLIAINGLGRDTIEMVDYIQVYEDTEADFSFAINGYDVNFSNISQHATVYSWNFGDGNVSTEMSPVHTYENPGSYSVTLIAEGVCGKDTVTYELEINDLSPVITIATNANRGCVPLTIQFMDLSTNNPTSWNWEFEGGTPAISTEQNPEVIYQIPGVYRVTLEVSNNFGSSKAVYDSLITVLPLAEADFSISQRADTIDLTNRSMNYSRLQWDFGDGNTSMEPDPQHVYESNGTYTVMLIVINECGADTMTQEVIVSVSGVFNPEPLASFDVFPNPNDGIFTVRLKDPYLYGEIEMEVRDLLGKQIASRRVDAFDLKEGMEWNILNDHAGTYLIVLRQKERVSVLKISVMR